MENKEKEPNLNDNQIKQKENVDINKNESETEILKGKIKPSNDNKIKIIYFFITEFGFIFILGIILLLLYVIPEYHSAKTFTSKISNLSFNSNYNPKIFIHITDIHISQSKSYRLDGSSIFLISLIQYKPDFFISTGDLVDNFQGRPEKLGMQREDEWKMYNTTIRSFLLQYPVIDVSGNHDLWAVGSPTSANNNFLNFSFMFNRTNVKNEDDFYIKKINMFDICFILLNDFRFPVIRPPYGIESHINKHQLDLLENMIDNIEEDECVILSHYPVDRTIYTISSKRHYFHEIISKKKVSFLFTGHEHPSRVRIVHHGEEGGLEFCTPSSFEKRAGLITIDNNNLIYHEAYIPYYGNKTLFFLTYPVPNDQISSHHIFNLNDFEIRVITYVNNKNIHLRIEGDINGELRYKKTLNNGAHLYSYPASLNDGSYKIHIYDEDGYSCDIKTEFTIGQKFKGKKEKYIGRISFISGSRFILIPFWLFLFIIVIPFMPELNINIVKNIENYIENDKNNNLNINPFLLYLCLIFLGPFFVRQRFQTLHKVLKYSLFCALLYPLVLPIHFQSEFNGIICYTFFVFVVVGSNKVVYDNWALHMTFIFCSTIVFPYILFASGKKYYEEKSKIIIIINSIITIIGFIVGFVINFLTVAQSIVFGFLFFSTAFIIIWTIIFIVFLLFFKMN